MLVFFNTILTLFFFDFSKIKNLLVLSDREENMISLRKHMLRSISELLPEIKMLLIDPDGALLEWESKVKAYVSGDEQIGMFSKTLAHEINNRKSNEANERWVIVIDNLEKFSKDSKITEVEFKELFEQGPKVGIHILITGFYNYIGTSYEAIPKYVKANSPQAVFSMRLADQTMFDKPYNASEPPVQADEAYYHQTNGFMKMKYTK